ncbi:hypothetical protein [Streptomyces aquilus]|nr:hypothetical protein [Streptomyces aquilus]
MTSFANRVVCGTRSQTSVVAALDADWTRLVDRGCCNVWSKQLG